MTIVFQNVIVQVTEWINDLLDCFVLMKNKILKTDNKRNLMNQ